METPRISSLLSDDLIRLGLSHGDKAALMEHLVKELCAAKSLADAPALLAQMRKREEGIQTTLDTGLSLPHARIDGLPETAAILGLPAKPIVDPKFADIPIRAMLLFLSPNRREAYPQQLQLLRGIALLFQESFLEGLLAAKTPGEALGMIRDREAALAKA